MTLAFDIPECTSSPLSRLDPRWKLAGIGLAVLSLTPIRTWPPALAALAGTLVLVGLSRIPWSWYVRRLAIAMTMFALFLAWLPFYVEDGQPTLQVGILTLSVPGLQRLVALTAKLGAMLSLVLVLLATSPLHDLLKAAHALRVPGLLIQLVLLTHRYVFLLIEEFDRLRNALRVRGFRAKTDLHTYRTIGQVAGTLLVRSGERAERVGQTMRCRGFDGEFRSLHDFRTTVSDVALFAVLVGSAVFLLAWDWQGR
jgi:cobalt/nickel transport system permease protein